VKGKVLLSGSRGKGGDRGPVYLGQFHDRKDDFSSPVGEKKKRKEEGSPLREVLRELEPFFPIMSVLRCKEKRQSSCDKG